VQRRLAGQCVPGCLGFSPPAPPAPLDHPLWCRRYIKVKRKFQKAQAKRGKGSKRLAPLESDSLSSFGGPSPRSTYLPPPWHMSVPRRTLCG
jgi:hypothetical protein